MTLQDYTRAIGEVTDGVNLLNKNNSNDTKNNNRCSGVLSHCSVLEICLGAVRRLGA